METKYKSLSTRDFHHLYPDHETCLKRLADYKWHDGYSCKHCGHMKFCSAGTNPKRKYSRQCTRCRYIESPTAGTVFHHVKFPLHKAFEIVYLVANPKKGNASTELARELQLRQKTCWLFKQKVMKAMSSSGNSPLTGLVEVGAFIFGHRTEKDPQTSDQVMPGKRFSGKKSGRKRKRKKKKLAIVAVERRGRGASRIYGRVIDGVSAKELGKFMDVVIDPSAKVVCNGWAGYKPLAESFESMVQSCAKDKGNNRYVLKTRAKRVLQWLRGTHGHAERLQGYLDEFSYRYNRHSVKGGLFEGLIDRMMDRPPCPYKSMYCSSA